MDVDPILDLLKSAEIGFKQYAGVEELADIQTRLKTLPAVFIIPLSMQGATNSHSVGVVDQRITQRFTVLAVFNKASKGELHRIEQAIMATLVGWSHPDMQSGRPGTPCEFVAQRTFNLHGNLATSLDFTTSYHFRK
ncbi:phage tail terminator protein [Paremcibacter congregatus]|uniref:phage tail terminator protein n=1 Tax=Paremcibacter congregatus TaxID=2043170 RepID=UPI0030EB6A01